MRYALLSGYKVRETEKAILLRDSHGKAHWLPKSQACEEGERGTIGGLQKLYSVPQWLVRKNEELSSVVYEWDYAID
jgi:hypothetical protein